MYIFWTNYCHCPKSMEKNSWKLSKNCLHQPFSFWQNIAKNQDKKRAISRPYEEMSPKFWKFHVTWLLPSGKITTPSPSSNPKSFFCSPCGGIIFITLTAIVTSFSPSFLQPVYLHCQQWLCQHSSKSLALVIALNICRVLLDFGHS